MVKKINHCCIHSQCPYSISKLTFNNKIWNNCLIVIIFIGLSLEIILLCLLKFKNINRRFKRNVIVKNKRYYK